MLLPGQVSPSGVSAGLWLTGLWCSLFLILVEALIEGGCLTALSDFVDDFHRRLVLFLAVIVRGSCLLLLRS